MRHLNLFHLLVITLMVQITIEELANGTLGPDTNAIDGRRKKRRRSKSTSSSSGSKSTGEDKSDKNSLKKEDLSMSQDTSESSSSRENIHRPVSSAERTGWRKWHRKCTPCPEDMKKKWRDPSIRWICGGYQRARRSFKSLCMMHYRNCQDGTMFVKLHNHRCENNTYFGHHFFYDYKARLSDDSSDSTKSSSSSSLDDSDTTLSVEGSAHEFFKDAKNIFFKNVEY